MPLLQRDVYISPTVNSGSTKTRGGSTHPDSKCWLALVSRIPDMYFKESFQEEVKDWQNSITVPKVWQRVLLWPFANTEEPKGEITNEKGEPLRFSGECFS